MPHLGISVFYNGELILNKERGDSWFTQGNDSLTKVPKWCLKKKKGSEGGQSGRVMVTFAGSAAQAGVPVPIPAGPYPPLIKPRCDSVPYTK